MMASLHDKWVVDSGASSHYAKERQSIFDFSNQASGSLVTIAGSAKLSILGNKCIQVTNNKNIPCVFYVPTITSNLMSVRSLIDRGHIVIFDARNCFVTNHHDIHKIFLKGHHDLFNRLYVMRLSTSGRTSLPKRHKGLPLNRRACTIFASLGPTNACKRLWHRRLGHPNFQCLYLMST